MLLTSGYPVLPKRLLFAYENFKKKYNEEYKVFIEFNGQEYWIIFIDSETNDVVDVQLFNLEEEMITFLDLITSMSSEED